VHETHRWQTAEDFGINGNISRKVAHGLRPEERRQDLLQQAARLEIIEISPPLLQGAQKTNIKVLCGIIRAISSLNEISKSPPREFTAALGPPSVEQTLGVEHVERKTAVHPHLR
jgi:hypothetical protein